MNVAAPEEVGRTEAAAKLPRRDSWAGGTHGGTEGGGVERTGTVTFRSGSLICQGWEGTAERLKS
jgi:hypothetical protein